VPLYSVLRSIGLVGTAGGMILVYVLKQIPLTVFVYTGFFRSLPTSYEEAALIDGASRLQIFTRVVMPQMNAVTGTALVLNALYIWNDLFDQLVFLSGSNTLTLPVAIYSLTFTNISRWNIIFAAVVISLVPMVLLYLFMQRKMMTAFSGGLKG
jgi:raffinose/stachyose/melibiose transport system permease protein